MRLALADDRPKCLVPIGARPLLDRTLDTLDALGIPATLVVGHGARHIESHVARRPRGPAFVFNARYAEGSILSLATGLASLGGLATADAVLVMDGDVAFDTALLERFCEHPADDALLVDVGAVFTDEQFMAGIAGDRVVQLHRAPAEGHDAQGEWVGFTKLGAKSATRLYTALTARIARGETTGGYEDALGGMLSGIAFTCVPTNGQRWVEIDFAADLERAQELFGASP